MIEDRAVQRFGGSSKPPRGAQVGFAGTRISARVIMRKDDAGAAVKRGVGDDLAQREVRAAFVPRMA